ncbi:putative membrane mmpL4 domain protein [Mycobacterium xenopi 3993]|nr:putative membrane mmpL4 domain protein [Mycobacterium xenopi 3993]
MINQHIAEKHTAPPFAARTIHRFAVPIILAWLAIAFIVSAAVPPLEQVEKERSVSLSPTDARRSRQRRASSKTSRNRTPAV